MSKPLASGPLDRTDETLVGDERTLVGDEQTLAAEGRSAPRSRRPLRGQQLGRYVLIDELGRGAMGQVFSAYDPDLDRRVAIKLINDDTEAPTLHSQRRERFLQEAKAMARIDHPHVVRVYDVGVHEGSIFLAMEVVEGSDLAAWLKAERSRDELLDVFEGCARGLAAAHAAGVIHRDFKPANVLVTKQGHAKVGDFGLAEFDDGLDSLGEGQIIGTPAYMSPEHISGKDIDARSDQFSFAIALHEALYGRRPFTAETLPELTAKVIAGEVDVELTERRGPLDVLVRRALSAEPDARFPSMDALVADLERISRPQGRGWILAGVALLVVLGIAVWGGDEPTPCRPGAEFLEEFWNADARRRLEIEGSDYTALHIEQSRDCLEQALDDYAHQWSSAYDQSCAAVGPGALAGSAEQRLTAECLDDRRGSMRGMVEFITADAVDPARVTALVDTLPSIDDCIHSAWYPYPTDPEKAAQVAALHEQLDQISRARLADSAEHLKGSSAAVVDQARSLGEPYLLSRALAEHARFKNNQGLLDEARSLLNEALEVALAAGYESQAGKVVNHILLVAVHDRDSDWAELEQLAALGRGLAARNPDRSHSLLGNIALNQGIALRRLERYEDALDYDRLAERHYAAAGMQASVANARLNQVISMIQLERYEDAERQLDEVIGELDLLIGPSSTEAMLGRSTMIWLMNKTERMDRGFEVSTQMVQRARERYAPTSRAYRTAVLRSVVTATQAGELEYAKRALQELGSDTSMTKNERLEFAIRHVLLATYSQNFAAFDRWSPTVEALAKEVNEPRHVWWERLQRAWAHFVRGHATQVHELLSDPAVYEALLAKEPDESTRVRLVVLSILGDAPLSSGTHGWRLLSSEETLSKDNRLLAEAAEAVRTGVDARSHVERVREAIIQRYGPNDPDAHMLEVWLANNAKVSAGGRLAPAPAPGSLGPEDAPEPTPAP